MQDLDCSHDSLDVVIGGDAFLDLKDDLSGFIGTFCFEVVALGLCGLVYHDLHWISMTNIDL
jgi:hypothetical protein